MYKIESVKRPAEGQWDEKIYIQNETKVDFSGFLAAPPSPLTAPLHVRSGAAADGFALFLLLCDSIAFRGILHSLFLCNEVGEETHNFYRGKLTRHLALSTFLRGNEDLSWSSLLVLKFVSKYLFTVKCFHLYSLFYLAKICVITVNPLALSKEGYHCFYIILL